MGFRRLSETVTAPAPALASVGMSDENASVLWLSKGDRIFLGVVAPVAGGAAGYVLPRLASWTTTLEWVPFQGPLGLVASWSGWLAQCILVALGVVLGAGFVMFAFYESLRVVVTETSIELTEDGETRELSRSEIAMVFVDGKELVILDGSSRQLVRAPIEEKTATIKQTFTAYGYLFVDGDPYRALYHRWVPDTLSLPPEADAIMRAREKALEKKSTSDARDLRCELDRIGIVIRDVKTAQYWRPLVRR